MRSPRICVASPSFSRHPTLRAELLARFPDAAFHDGRQPLTGDALVRFLADADGIVVGLERIDEALVARVPRLRIVAKYGVGLDNIALGACAARRIAVGWTPGVNAGAVAELTLTLMLGLATGAFARAAELRAGVWNKVGGTLLGGRTVGIIGLGHVGRAVAALLEPFRCHILGNDVEDRRAWCEAADVLPASKDEIYATADVVTLHVPLSRETHHLIDAAALACFRTDAVLVNASRGPVVDLDALREALLAGRLRGAALDVWEEEPAADPALLALPNVIGTPHIGGSAEEDVVAMGRAAIGHLVDHFEAAVEVGEERVPA